MSGIIGGAGSKSGGIARNSHGKWTQTPNASGFGSFSAEWSRAGRIVQVRAYCNFNATNSGFNSISGLPFPVASGQHTFFSASSESIAQPGGGFNNDNCTIWCYAGGGTSNINFGAWGWSIGWGGSLGVTSSSILMFSGVYSTDS